MMRGTEKFRSVSWSQDGRYIVAAGHGGTVALWNTVSGRLEVVVRNGIDAILGYVMCVTLSRTNQLLVVGAMYGAFVFSSIQLDWLRSFKSIVAK